MTLDQIQFRLDLWLSRHLGGHKRLGRFTFFGHNGMQWAVEYRTIRGWLVMRPISWSPGRWNGWYIYHSPDATPSCAWWGYGPGFRRYGDNDPLIRAERRVERGHE